MIVTLLESSAAYFPLILSQIISSPLKAYAFHSENAKVRFLTGQTLNADELITYTISPFSDLTTYQRNLSC